MEYFGLRFGGGPGSGRRKGSKRKKKTKKQKMFTPKGFAVNASATRVVKAYKVKDMKGRRYRNKELIPRGYFSANKAAAKRKLAKMKKAKGKPPSKRAVASEQRKTRDKVAKSVKQTSLPSKEEKGGTDDIRGKLNTEMFNSAYFGRGTLYPGRRNRFGAMKQYGIGAAYTGMPLKAYNYRFRGNNQIPKNNDRVPGNLRLSFYDGTYRADGFPDAHYPPGTNVSKFGSRFLM